MLVAPSSSPGVVLSQPPISTAPSIGMRAQQLLRLHRQHVAIQHAGRLQVGLSDKRQRRQLHRKAARHQDAAAHVVDALLEVHVAGLQVGPGVQDRDDGLAGPFLRRVAHLHRARPVPETAQVGRAEPAGAAQVGRPLAALQRGGRNRAGFQARGERSVGHGWAFLDRAPDAQALARPRPTMAVGSMKRNATTSQNSVTAM